MKRTIEKVMASSTSKASKVVNVKKSATAPNVAESLNTDELKQQTTDLTLRVLPKVLDELGVKLESLTKAQINRLNKGVVQMSENLFDTMSAQAKKDGFEMNLSDRYAATALVTNNFVRMFKSFKNLPTWHIACLITLKIAECDQLSEEYAERVYELCCTLIENHRNQI